MVDIQRGTSGVNLPADVSSEIWKNVTENSVVQKVATQIQLPGNGISVDIISGEATASWVLETAVKPVSKPTVSSKLLTPYTLSVLVPFSNQFKRDKNGLYNAMIKQLPQALAKKFDQTVFGYATAPGSGFDTLATAPQVSINTANTGYAGLISALDTIAAAGGELSDILGSTQATSKFLGQLDTTGRPLFQGNLLGLGGSLLGVPYVPSRHVHKASAAGAGNSQVLAIAGDWEGSAFWGQVGAISVAFSDQATILDSDGTTLLNLFQRNMFAVRVEVELGFAVKDVNRFVKLTGTPNS